MGKLVVLIVMPRTSRPQYTPDNRYAVLAFVDDAHPLAWQFGPVARVRERFWAYKFDAERNPNAAKRYGVDIWPTYLVLKDNQELWRTSCPFALAAGLGVAE